MIPVGWWRLREGCVGHLLLDSLTGMLESACGRHIVFRCGRTFPEKAPPDWKLCRECVAQQHVHVALEAVV